jgi:hypothetical protein
MSPDVSSTNENGYAMSTLKSFLIAASVWLRPLGRQAVAGYGFSPTATAHTESTGQVQAAQPDTAPTVMRLLTLVFAA